MLRREISPDGLTFLVERCGPTIIMKFEGAGWHLHPELLPRFDGDPERTAMSVVDDLVANRILMLRETDVEGPYWSLLADIALEQSLLGPNETLNIRTWHGERVEAEDLTSGKRDYCPL